jgi:hypothetical protein
VTTSPPDIDETVTRGLGFALRFQGVTDGLTSTGRVTSWRRTGGRTWVVTIYDLGVWRRGEPDPRAEDNPR